MTIQRKVREFWENFLIIIIAGLIPGIIYGIVSGIYVKLNPKLLMEFDSTIYFGFIVGLFITIIYGLLAGIVLWIDSVTNEDSELYIRFFIGLVFGLPVSFICRYFEIFIVYFVSSESNLEVVLPALRIGFVAGPLIGFILIMGEFIVIWKVRKLVKQSKEMEKALSQK